MTEALNRHLPERPRLRVPLRTRVPVRRPHCRPTLGATLKPSTLPFAALKAMSENPAMFRRFWSLLPLVILALTFSSLRAAETNAPASTPAPTPVTAPAVPVAPSTAASAPAVAPAAAPASTNANGVAPATTPPAADAGPRERTRDRASSSGTNGSPGAVATNAPLGSYESFRLIADRNIFDPNRSPRVTRSSGSSEEPKRVPKVEAFALAGTMSFSNRHMAFFTSASSQYQKALKSGDAIAGYAVAAVELDHVKLEKDGATVELKLNQQLRREDEGPWQVSARSEVVASSPPAAPASSGAPTGAGAGATATGASGSASELLKRLMEQRAKEQ